MYKFANIGKFIGLVLLVVILFVWVFKGNAESIQQACPQWGTVQSAILTNEAHPENSPNFHNGYDFGTSLSADQLKAINSWDVSYSTWAGYQSDNPLGQPIDSYADYNIILQTNAGTRYLDILFAPSDPQHIYLMAFTTLRVFADANGQHNGYHPCRAYRLPISAMEVLNVR